MKTKIKVLLTLCVLAATMAGCKPTEKGYRQAYEAAKGKKEQADPDDDILTGGHRLLSDYAVNWKIIDGDSLQLRHLRLKPTDGGAWPQSGPYRLAVAMLKMSTNVKSLLQDLKGSKGLTPVAAEDGQDTYYIIAGSATYVDSLSHVLSTFKKEHPNFQYIGMNQGRPLIIVGR